MINFKYQMSSLAPRVCIATCVQVPRMISLSCCVQHSLTFDCCCAEDFRNQQLLPPSPSLCLYIACVALCMFSAWHATVAIPLSEPASKLTSEHLQATTQTLRFFVFRLHMSPLTLSSSC